MRSAVRMALATATTLAVTLPMAGSALGAPTPSIPSQAQVDQAKQDVVSKKASVAQIESALAAAQARMQSATNAAEIAAEKYNGAMWRLSVARKATLAAKAAETKARNDVAVERAGIVALVTESYQNGTALNTATALMGGEGPKGLMNRYAVVQSAGESMQAHYDTFRHLSALAADATAAANRAQKEQQSLTADAKSLAAAAGQAATAAGVAASQIATQKQQLVQALAKAEHISVQLATQRQNALAAIAAQKAAELAKQHELAVQAALQQQAEEAAQKAKQAEQQASNGGTSGDAGASLPPVVSGPVTVSDPAPSPAVAVQRAIAYARAQIGKPYQWGGAGPNTFDCSGLTMQAWARGGIALGHYTGAQWDESTPISMADAQPGDLLFFSSDGTVAGIHHVALYIGGGQYIEAPHTGAFVRYSSIYNWYPTFVGRPRG